MPILSTIAAMVSREVLIVFVIITAVTVVAAVATRLLVGGKAAVAEVDDDKSRRAAELALLRHAAETAVTPEERQARDVLQGAMNDWRKQQ